MAAIDINGVIAHELSDDAYNGIKFIKFITEKLVPYFKCNTNSILVMNNISYKCLPINF